MRLHWLSIFVLSAACGGGSSTVKPDAAAQHDTMPAVDAAIDARAIDAPPDAPVSTAKTRVWTVGDYLVDNTTVAGAFEDGATLPFNTANQPTLLVPAAGHQLYAAAAKSGNSPAVDGARFSATPDGTKIAFVADVMTAGQFDLYVANGDGTGVTRVITGGATTHIPAIAISPDGTLVAFTQDDVTSLGNFDLYVVAADGNTAAKKLSPDRTAASTGTDVFAGFTWSNDSKYVAFSGDLTTDKFDQAYVVDATAATPAAVTLLAKADIATQASGAQGVRGRLLFDHDGAIYFRARVSTANASQFTFFTAVVAGVRTDITTLAPPRGDASTPDVGAFGITPDGQKLVFSTDTTLGNYDVYVTTIGATTATRLTTIASAGAPSFLSPFYFAPDGSRVAYTFKATGGRADPVVTALDGSGSHRLVNVAAVCQAANGNTACASPDATSLQWTANSQGLYLQGDIMVNNSARLYRLDPTMTDQTPTLAVDGAATTAVVVDQITTIAP